MAQRPVLHGVAGQGQLGRAQFRRVPGRDQILPVQPHNACRRPLPPTGRILQQIAQIFFLIRQAGQSRIVVFGSVGRVKRGHGLRRQRRHIHGEQPEHFRRAHKAQLILQGGIPGAHGFLGLVCPGLLHVALTRQNFLRHVAQLQGAKHIGQRGRYGQQQQARPRRHHFFYPIAVGGHSLCGKFCLHTVQPILNLWNAQGDAPKGYGTRLTCRWAQRPCSLTEYCGRYCRSRSWGRMALLRLSRI